MFRNRYHTEKQKPSRKKCYFRFINNSWDQDDSGRYVGSQCYNIGCTVELRFTDTHLIRTPCYYGQLSLSLERALTFSLNLTRTPVNADKGHLFLAQSTELISQKVNLPNADTYQLFAVISVDVTFRLFWHQSSYAGDSYV